METLIQDISCGIRGFLKRPGFTAIAVMTLALGIGANTTIFSTVDALILRPFSFPNQLADPGVYFPYSQNIWRTMNLVIRTTQDPTRLASAVRSEVSALDPNLPVYNVKAVGQMIDERISPKRLMTYVLGVFALIALLLAAVGIYGVMSYAVTQRTHEIGSRMALGAQALDVLKLVVRSGMILALIGVAIGLPGAFALTRLLANFLFHVTPTDAVTFAAVSFSVIVVALFACYVPARRATKVDPLVALRYE